MSTKLATAVGQICTALAAAKIGDVAAFAKVYRGPYSALLVDELPAVIVWPDSMALGPSSDGKPTREVPLLLCIVTRGSESSADAELAELLQVVLGVIEKHPTLTAAYIAAPTTWDFDFPEGQKMGDRIWASGSATLRILNTQDGEL